ncbi:hypothetical protein BDV93DRAFT_257775 [Ceratobasidium sp. AG-I]|nr:hypothetical protein BDV93DRAFT_257775 [Ceratobasidium sp. AG-I]
MYRRRGFKPVYQAGREAPLISSTDISFQQPVAPPMGYVSSSSINEAPPLYSLPTLISPSYQGSATHWSPYGEVQRGAVAECSRPRPPVRSGKSRYAPAGTTPS